MLVAAAAEGGRFQIPESQAAGASILAASTPAVVVPAVRSRSVVRCKEAGRFDLAVYRPARS